MRWTRRKAQVAEPVNLGTSIADPALTVLFGGSLDGTNVPVSEFTTLGSSAFYRAIMLISGTLASLPLRSYKMTADDQPKTVESVFDDPDGPDGQTPSEWKQTLFIHQILHGAAYALKVRTQAGALVRLPLVHPLSIQVEEPTLDEYANPSKLPPGNIWFILSLEDGTQKKLTLKDIFYVPGPSLDGKRGLGLIQVARQSIQTTLSGDKAAHRLFSNGALISGLATPEDEYDITDDLPKLRREINREMLGADKAGTIAIVNRRLKFQPWTMSSVDAQFLQQRQFSVEEVARWTGVPPHLLMQTEKQTSWGTGIEEQNRALGRTVLNPWAIGFEERATREIRPANRWVEFEFAGLERPSPDKEIELLLKQTGKPFLTVNEARKIRNLPPIPGGDVLQTDAASLTVPEKEGEENDPDASKPE